MTATNVDALIRRHLTTCGTRLGGGEKVEGDLAAAIDLVGGQPNLRGCLDWLQEGLGTRDSDSFARELLRIYHKYDDCRAGSLGCYMSDQVLSTLLRQDDWSEYVVYNVCGLAMYDRLPVEFHSGNTLEAFEQAKEKYRVTTRLGKQTGYYDRHTTGKLGDHGLGRGWMWSNIVYGGSAVAYLLWPGGGDDVAEMEDDIGFYYEVGLHLLTPLGVDEGYLGRIFDRIVGGGRRRSIPALLSLDYMMRHMAQEKQYARIADGQHRVARFNAQCITLWEMGENGFLQFHYDTRYRQGLDPTDGYLVASLVHRIADVGAEMATGEMLNPVASMVLEAFSGCGNLVRACFMVWREVASWLRVELVSRRTCRTTAEAVASALWAHTAYRHPCEEWAAVAWRVASKEMMECGPLLLDGHGCQAGMAGLFGHDYRIVPDDVVGATEKIMCVDCAEIEAKAHDMTEIASGRHWQQRCQEIRQRLADRILHLSLCQRSSAETKREIEIRLAWEYVASPKCLATMVGSILCGDVTAGVASDRPTQAITLPDAMSKTEPMAKDAGRDVYQAAKC
ncbi:hypothetical protein CDD82_4083 [Ophiocordyceps australis]|uniref:Uncharacterized protein n=1 Tax=Ophiocordyceps australis TaxID=1399860 RepID=A0A2C5Z313_9HYPO|nr:hypothetical protein CDD82_4083 [Ophiocordyceps australis]